MSGSSSSPQFTTVCVDRPTSTPRTINNGTAALVIFDGDRRQAGHASPFEGTLSRGVNTGPADPVCARSQKSGQIRPIPVSPKDHVQGRVQNHLKDRVKTNGPTDLAADSFHWPQLTVRPAL